MKKNDTVILDPSIVFEDQTVVTKDKQGRIQISQSGKTIRFNKIETANLIIILTNF